MRQLKHIVYTVFIILLIGFIAWKASPVLVSWLTVTEKGSERNPAGTTVQLTYQLDQDKWTTFPIDTGTRNLKLLTNASYFNTYVKTIKYAIEVQLLNASSKVLLDKTLYFKNDAKVYKKKKSSRIMSNPFLQKGGNYITPSLTFLTSLSNFKKPAYLKLRQYKIKDVNNVEKVLVRVYSETPVSKSKRNILWYRLSPAAKKSMASGNFYPYNMLTNTEKQNILRNSWSPIGPEGNKGNDYSVRRIAQMPTDVLKKINLLNPDGNEPKKEDNENIKSEMYKLYLDSGIGGLFKRQSQVRIDAAKKLFIKSFKGSTASELKNDWNKLGMNILELKRGKRVFTLIYEQPDKLFGRGFYIFCKSSIARNAVLELPHRFWDTHTGIIGYRLMLSGYYTAAAWNTVQRYQTPNDQRSSSDMAHAENSFFYSFTMAFAESMPKKSVLIQLHGFSNKKQKSYFGKKASVVLSNSTSNPLRQFLYYAKLIKKIMPEPTYIYPLTNVKWLAALENISAKILRNKKKKQIFIHMEMNGKTRKKLKKDTKLRENFTECIIKDTAKHYPAIKK
jgi:hypothetical protein